MTYVGWRRGKWMALKHMKGVQPYHNKRNTNESYTWDRQKKNLDKTLTC